MIKTPWVSGRVNSCHIGSISPDDSSSQQNASIAFGYYCCEIEADASQFDYHCTKLKGTQKLVPCKVKDSVDSGFNVSMIKRSALPKGIITKLLGDTKLVRTLAGHLKMQKVVTQDLRLPEFDQIQTTQKETWNGLITPSHFVHLEVWIWMNSTPWKTCLSQRWALWWRLTQMFCNRNSGC